MTAAAPPGAGPGTPAGPPAGGAPPGGAAPGGPPPGGAAPGGAAPGGTVVGPSAPQLWRRLRAPLLALALVLLAAFGIGLAQSGRVEGELDPRAVDPAGSRALATLLAERGVEVRRVTDVDAAGRASTARTTVLVAFPNLVPAAGLRRLAAGLPGDARLVLVGPDGAALDAVTDAVTVSSDVDVARREPGCPAPAAGVAGPADTGGRGYRPGEGATACYGDQGVATLVLATTRAGADLVVLGGGAAMTNDRLDENGNAALSLLLLGADGTSDRVVWLMPVPGSAADGSSSPFDVLPPGGFEILVQLLLAGLVAALWRVRRLGPPVVEPLPVVVRAAETVEGRSRLYRRADARDRAAEALRAGALARLVPRLGLGTDPPPSAIVDMVVHRTGLPGWYAHGLLFGPPPADDAALVRLADDLDGLVSAVLGRPTAPNPPDVEVRRS